MLNYLFNSQRDIKSPIAIAEQKQATRKANALLQNPNENISVVTPSSSRFAVTPASTSGTPIQSGPGAQNPSSVTPSASDTLPNPTDKPYTKDTRLHRPPVLQPISARAKAAAAAGALNSGKTTPGSGAQANFPDLPSPGMRGAGMGSDNTGGDEVPKAGYAIAIYPYTAEREDEFDVQV
jgi:bZIP factor